MAGSARRRLGALAGAALAVLAPVGGVAQVFPQPNSVPLAMGQDVRVPRAPLLTIDQEKLFADSVYGQRVQADLLEASRSLAAENRQIEADLAAREQELTDLRDTLPFEEFRALADAFDLRVTQARRAQDAKTRALQRRRDLARQSFFASALPVLSQIVREAGAVAILDRTAVFLTSEEIDVTDLAIARLDRTLGDGGDQAAPADPDPDPALAPDAAPASE